MRTLFLTYFLATALLCLQPVSAVVYQYTDLSACPQQCIQSGIRQSACDGSAFDLKCLCADATFRANVGACATSNCTTKETLATLNFNSHACGEPIRDRSNTNTVVTWVFFALATIAIMCRWTAQFKYGRFHLASDATMAFIYTVDVALVVLVNDLTGSGLGRDIWNVTPNHISSLLRSYWIGEMLYMVTVWSIRSAFVIFFLQIFPEKWFQRLGRGIIVFNTLATITFVFAICFVCNPRSYLWNSWDGEHTGTCLNHNALVYASAGLGIAADIATLVLPLTQIWSLQMGRKKKIGVALMFSIGAFVTVISMVRLNTLVKFGKTTNPTWDYLEPCMWSIIEIEVGIICLCMPAIRLGLGRLLPGLMLSSHRSRATAGRASGLDPEAHGIIVKKTFTASRSKRPPGDSQDDFLELVDVDTKSFGGRAMSQKSEDTARTR